MSFFYITKDKENNYERGHAGVQDVFYEGRGSIWDYGAEQKDMKQNDEETGPGIERMNNVEEIEQMRNIQFASFRHQWQKWANRTTFHGIYVVFDSKSRKIRRIVWLGVIVYMIYSLCGGCIIQLNRFLSYKTLNQETIYFEETLAFPSVTICNLNRIHNDTVNDPRDREIIRNLYMRVPNKTALMEYPGLEYTRNVNLREMFTTSAMTVQDIFKFCSFDVQFFENCSDVLEGRFAGPYFCHTFNSDSKNNSFHALLPGSDYGLKLVLWTNQDKYFISDSATAGFKVLVHDKGEEPDIEQALAVGPGFSHYLSIRKHERLYKPSPAKAFGDRECLDTKAASFRNPLNYSTKYSYNACHDECWNTYIYQTCGCIGPADIGNETRCDPFQIIECYYRAFVNFSAYSCFCAIPCHMTTYRTQLSSTYYPNVNYFDQLYGRNIVNVSLPYDKEHVRDDVLFLRVFFDTKIVTRHEQVLEFNKEDLQSSLGGYIGLFIGASLITLLEFLEHVFASFVRCCRPETKLKT